MVLCPDSSFGSEGRGFFGGEGLDLFPESRILGDRSGTISACVVTVDRGDSLIPIPVIFRNGGGCVLPSVSLLLHVMGGEACPAVLGVTGGFESLVAILFLRGAGCIPFFALELTTIDNFNLFYFIN